MAKKESKIPDVLAFEKKLVPSDGYMYETLWEDRADNSKRSPLKLVEKAVRGTISNRLKDAQANDETKINADVKRPNPQRVDNCALSMNKDSLVVEFTLKILGNIEKPSACSKSEFAVSYAKAVNEYVDQFGFTELAKRYVTNLANARFLWRNRFGAQKIEVRIACSDTKESIIFEDAKQISLRNFDNSDKRIDQLAEKVAEALSGKLPYLLLTVTAIAKVGAGQDVYPSEELVLDKSNKKKGQKSKKLYSLGEKGKEAEEDHTIAAMHSQKIGNAIRTIDTWYPDYQENGPIAVEPYGSVTNLGKAYRVPKQGNDFFSLFDKFGVGENLANVDDKHYVMAILVRGGVFGESSKE